MKTAKAGTQWTAGDLPLADMVLIHWVGGSYGHFLYRMMHRHISGFPDIRDDFVFFRGNSHSVNHDAYISDIKPEMLRDRDVVLSIFRDFEYEHVAVKKHHSVSLPVPSTRMISEAKLNVKINLEDKSLAAWSIIQNIIKIQDPYRYYNKELVDNILSDDIDVDSALIHLMRVISSTHKSWFRPSEKDNFFNVGISVFFDPKKIIRHFDDLAARLGTTTKNMHAIKNELELFYESQKYIKNLRRHLSMTWDTKDPVDSILKACYEDINHQ